MVWLRSAGGLGGGAFGSATQGLRLDQDIYEHCKQKRMLLGHDWSKL